MISGMTTGILNCVAYNGGSCSFCAQGYSVSGGQCATTIHNCATYYLGYC
jgi:hypothetical protein